MMTATTATAAMKFIIGNMTPCAGINLIEVDLLQQWGEEFARFIRDGDNRYISACSDPHILAACIGSMLEKKEWTSGEHLYIVETDTSLGRWFNTFEAAMSNKKLIYAYPRNHTAKFVFETSHGKFLLLECHIKYTEK